MDEKGEAREIDYFSAGTVDSVMLCMRLALIDALFKQEKPFVLLDDPFVNLDDEHTERALEMLKEIAKNKQVVYMVCNSSRCWMGRLDIISRLVATMADWKYNHPI